MREITLKLYQYGELEPKAQAKARDWYREASQHDDPLDNLGDDFGSIAKILGITFDQRSYKTVSGKTFQEPAIYWSLNYSHYPGLNFDGRWEGNTDAGAKIREYAPKDQTLHAIADSLVRLNTSVPDRPLSASIKASNRDPLPRNTEIEVYANYDVLPGGEDGEDLADEVAEALRDFMRWMYKQLEQEYEYRQSDEVVADTIEANEYEFTEDGERYQE